MLQPIKNWLQDNALLVALLISFTVALLSLISSDAIKTPRINVSDKFLHGLAYTGLMWSWLFFFRNKRTTQIKLFLFLGLLLFGIILELLQGELTASRTADWKDVLANTTGLLLGLISFPFLYKLFFKPSI